MLRDSEIVIVDTYRKLLSSLHPTTILLTHSYTIDRKTANINVKKLTSLKLCVRTP